MGPSVQGKTELGREAMKRHSWEEARGLLEAADADGALDAEGLRQLGKARDWCGDVHGALDAFERSYAAFVAAGERRKAAKVALMLRHVCANSHRDAAAARGWTQRAERLLEGEPDCPELGFLWRAQGRRAFLDGKPEAGRPLLMRAIDLGTRLGSSNLVAMSLSWLGVSLCEMGLAQEAFPFLDEACAAAVGGELGPWATGIVYCNTIGAYREAGEFGMAGEWTQTAGRWCQRESITGFPGICRVHRAEFMRLRGAWSDAEQEARRASGELEGNIPGFAGEAHYEIGMIRLRLGDLDGADAAFRRAHSLGRDPQPGAAILLATRGDAAGALRSLETAIASHELGFLDEMRCLGLQTEIACRLRNFDLAQRAVEKAEALATGQKGLGLQVLATQARGTLQLGVGDADAGATLRRAQRLWQEIDAPYEVAQVRLMIAQALRISGDAAGAAREVESAIETFERLGAAPDAARATELLDDGAAHAAPLAQRTLFFSDIVGSTQLVEAIGDAAWSDLVAWLDASLRTCFALHGGEEVDHAGDGFFVAFPDSKSALECAVDIQRKLAAHRREHGSVSDPRAVAVKGISKPVEVVRVGWTR